MAIMIVLSAVVERLQYLFAEGICSQLIAEDDKILDILRRLSLLLKDDGARSKHVRDENFAEVRQLGKIVYRIENLVESRQVGVASRDKMFTMRGILKRMRGWMANHNFRAELSILTDQINDILVLLPEPRQGSSGPRDNVGGPGLPRTSTIVREHWDGGQIIGREHDEEILVSALTGGSERLEVVSICGMGGVGKTTLARTLYNNPTVRQHFDVRAWITVTHEFRIRDIFLIILSEITESVSDPFASPEDLALEIYRLLKRRRWLVVLDDIWSIEAWESIKLVFPSDGNGSRILITTRLRNLALSMSRDAYIHVMGLLNEDQSWELFKKRAQLTDTELYTIQEQAEKIFRQSRGLPLAIVLLASTLKGESLDKWKLLLRDREERSVDPDSVSPLRLVALSYESLPSVLKPCLLYMGTFPDSSKIEAETMCQLWIAEGLVSEEHSRNNGVTTMELAGRCFDELTSRNLVQLPEEEMSTRQGFRYGSLHGLIRELCICRAEAEEFFQIVESWHANRSEDSVFRCAIYLDEHEKMGMHSYLRFDLRSLLFFNPYNQSGEYLIPAILDLSNLKWIRILHFDGVDFRGGTLPPGVENLVLLRHLSLRNCYLEKLPPYVSTFFFLITLDLRVKKGCKVIIPNVLFKLQKLRHLYLPLKFQTPNHDNLHLDGLKELEILENFDTSKCSAGDIVMLTRLRHLQVSSEGNLKDLEQIFKCIERNTDHLSRTSLDIMNFDSYSEERLSFIEKLFSCRVLHILRLQGRIGKMPELDATYASFTEIDLNGSQLEDDPMQTLKGLQNLRILVLESESYIGKELYCSKSGFPELRSLKLSRLYNLESWEVEIDAMPKLSTLTIENCRRMKMLPEELRYINALRKLKINMMSKEFVSRLRKVDGKGGEDLFKINTNCTIEFGSDNLWPESTDSIREQNNSFEDIFAEFQISSLTGTRDFASSSACAPLSEWEGNVYLQ